MNMFKKLIQASECVFNSNFRSHSTIFALSSGYGKCGVAVIRVSGSSTELALKRLTGMSNSPQPRMATLKNIKHPVTKEVLDKGLVIWFPGPRSFTGEDCCEFHVHGGVAVINSILNALSSIPDLRLAEPGEFTRRAFYKGKLDLTEVEGLSDLLQAETEIQRKQAFLQTQGSLSRLYHKWRNTLIRCVAHVEAHIDFEETETIEEGVLEAIHKEVAHLKNEIQRHLEDGRKGELLRNGVKTVILGEPNVGKSSLFNLLCKRPAAIVTPIEGTTRDILEITLNIGGYPLVLADTAGLRSKTDDVIEQEGISRAMQTYKNSDLLILVVDAQKCAHWLEQHRSSKITDYLKYYVNQIGIENSICSRNDFKNISLKDSIVVFNKMDLVKGRFELEYTTDINYVSCKYEEGVSSFIDNIINKLKILCGEPSTEHPSMNQMRHRLHLTNCIHNLDSYLNQSTNDTVIMAEHLRRALKHLGHLVGITTTEQLLDVIFKDFCIGK